MHHNQTHGHSLTGSVSKTYLAWTGMRKRCLSPSNKNFDDWGGRGITICPEWDSFEQFLKDMGEAPVGLTLDREDVNGGYSKANCRWATRTEQQQNRRCNQNFTVDGETHCVTEWARRFGLKTSTVFMRLERGWDIDRALKTKLLRRSNNEFNQCNRLSQQHRSTGASSDRRRGSGDRSG